MDNISRYAKSKEKGLYYYSKYKETGKDSYKRKANKKYAEAEACAIELGSNKSITKNLNIAYKSNNKTNSNTNWFSNNNIKTSIKNNKSNKNKK